MDTKSTSEALNQAVRFHKAGQLDLAECAYRDVLRFDPRHADALHLLGLTALQSRKYDQAVRHIHQAILLRPASARFHSNLAAAYRSLGRFADAKRSCRRSIGIDPNFPEAHFNLANTLREQGDFCQAIESYHRVLQLQPNFVEAFDCLGNTFQAAGRFDDAIDHYRKALDIAPEDIRARVNLGSCLREQGQLAEAAKHLEAAVELQPQNAEAHANLGSVYFDQGHLDQAVESYRQSIQLAPCHAAVHRNLGNAFKALGRLDEAIDCFRQALEEDASETGALTGLAAILHDQHRMSEAAEYYRRLFQLSEQTARMVTKEPGSQVTFKQTGIAKHLQAEQHLWKLRIAGLCPTVFAGEAEIEDYRSGLIHELQRVSKITLQPNVSKLNVIAGTPPYNLQYHGRDNLAIKQLYAEIYERCINVDAPKPRTGTPRVGFVVTAGHEGVFLRCLAGILNRLNPALFETVVVCSASGSHLIRTHITSPAVGVLIVPDHFERMIQTISQAEFDVIYHWEVGSDATNYLLPFFRLAAVQCSGWGLPDTSGIPAMDYFLTCATVEPPAANSQYTESLLRAGTLLTWQEPLEIPTNRDGRGRFGFEKQQTVYLCCQQIQKLQPEMDLLWGEILRRDARGIVVIPKDQYGFAAKQLRIRLNASIPDVADRVVFVPRLSVNEYAQLLQSADVLLDSLHFGAGVTAYDAFAFGKPLVTWPTRFRRSRYALACYRKMNIPDCIADSREKYVELAVRFGTDAEFREDVSRRISENSPILFRNQEAVREYERLFQHMIEQSRTC